MNVYELKIAQVEGAPIDRDIGPTQKSRQ